MIDLVSIGATPFWFVFVTVAVILLVVAELGFRIGSARSENQPAGSENAFGVATAALLGLVTFLMAFTFSIAASQYAERRATVLEEANIIGTVYYRAELLPDKEHQQLAQLLRDYVSLRRDAAARGASTEEYISIVKASEVMHAQMWTIVAGVAKEDPNETNALVLVTLNDLFDIHTVRVAYGFNRRIPPVIWLALIAVAGTAVAAMTYRTGAVWQKRAELTPALILAFAGVVTLIADLDNPHTGFLSGDQSPILELADALLGVEA